MLLFCYIDDYDDSEVGGNSPDIHDLASTTNLMKIGSGSQSLSPPTAGEEQTRDSGTVSSEGGQSPEFLPESEASLGDHVTEKLVNNVLVYAMAETYDIGLLKALALNKFKSLVESEDLPRKFTDVAHEVYTSTPASDKGLRDLVITKCIAHLGKLLSDTTFIKLLEEDAELASDILRHHHHKSTMAELALQVKISEQDSKLRDLQVREIAAIASRDEVQKEMDEKEKILRTYSHCRHCEAEFQCRFHGGERYLRCEKCKTRHW